MKAKVIFLMFRVALLTILVWTAHLTPTFAGGVVSDCNNDAQFNSLLAGGGDVTFNCGSVLIHLSSTKEISADTTIDGGGKITLSGDNVRRLFVVNAGTALTLHNIVLTNGFSSGDGGAILNNGALVLENGTTIRDSEAGASGGAIVSYGPLHIINSVLEGNKALNGGALYPRWSNAQTVIVSSVLRNNRTTSTTQGYGGAILVWDGARVALQDSDIHNNVAIRGGGIYNWANSVLFLGDTRLRDNAASIYGGGIYNAGTATLTNVTLSGNWTYAGGGGIYNAFSTMTLTNVTLSGNSTQSTGGGIYNLVSTMTVVNVTLSGNSAGDKGGGIYNNSGTVTVKNTIVANSSAGGNCNGGVTNSGFNFSSDASCGFGPGRDDVNVMLGPLADNGGPTQTHMPQPGSPAIDHGSGCPTTDQRSAIRPVGPACDVGAVEYGAVVGAPDSINIYLPLVLK
jgi:hypothetical protein